MDIGYRRLALMACVCLLLMAASLFALLSMIGFQSAPASASYSDLEVKTAMLTAAMDEVGVCSPRDAALLWAKGVKQRNAAMQYAALSGPLKERFSKAWEQTAPNWVTGVSSPWISEYHIADAQQKDGVYTCILEFAAETSTGPAGTHDVKLTVEEDGGLWHITQIEKDNTFGVYTGER